MSVSRRDFFRGALRRGQDAAARMARSGRRDRSLELLQRPPGAVAEGQFLASCTRCADCAAACPPQAIRIADESFGPQRKGTPYIDAAVQACVMCADLPCIDVCEPGVLRWDLPVRMSLVQVHEGGCLAWQGEPCIVCADACPVEGAITLDPGARPRIDDAHCTGCGTCLQVCPVGADGIHLEPAPARPFHPL